MGALGFILILAGILWSILTDDNESAAWAGAAIALGAVLMLVSIVVLMWRHLP